MNLSKNNTLAYATKCGLVLGFLLITLPAFGQFYETQYRPPGVDWLQLHTPHFNIVYPAGEDSAALWTGRILEHHYYTAQALVGGELRRFPVVLNNYNDLSNGFVSPDNFRSEIELPPIKGKSLNPRSGNWLESVVPHELVHALHFNHLPGFWANTVALFSPDAARLFHAAVPSGVHEGLATYYETESVVPGGGRGNHPYFYNRFNALFSSPHRWSMGQILSSPDYTRPYDRHYLGGYQFIHWLEHQYGPGVSKETIDRFIKFPFLGYGVALRRSTGLWPGELYNRFEEDMDALLQNDREPGYTALSIPFKGRELRRPVWLTETRLLMYGRFYNASRGFYIYDLDSGSFHLLHETGLVQDYNYDVDREREKVLFSNYHTSLLYDRTFEMDLFELSLESKDRTRITTGFRGYAPSFIAGGILSIQTDHFSSALVKADTTLEKFSLTDHIAIPDIEFISVQPNPAAPEQLAVIANKRGLQALWITNYESIRTRLSGPPDISFDEGSIYDPAWHPSGDTLLFTSDFSGSMQIYEYDIPGDSLAQLTFSLYNSMEASYSPGGSHIAFIEQYENEFLPVVLERGLIPSSSVPFDRWKFSSSRLASLNRPRIGVEEITASKSWEISPYRSGLRWLRPRSVFPAAEEISNTDTYQLGISLRSVDLLQRNRYRLDATVLQKRGWFDFFYRHSGFYPGFELSVFNRPSFGPVPESAGVNPYLQNTFLRQDVGFSLSLPFRLLLELDTRSSVLFFSPMVEFRNTRFFELSHDGSPASDFASFRGVGLSSQLFFRLRQNERDVQPRSGFILSSDLKFFLNNGSVTFSTIPFPQTVSFSSPTGFRSSLFWFTSPLGKWNQSLRIGLKGLTQSGPVFYNQSVVSDVFAEPVFAGSQNVMSFNTRYTIPLLFPDNGGFLLPVYLSNLYLVALSETVFDLNGPPVSSVDDLFSSSRSVFGLGIRGRFRFSGVSFDVGVGFSFEPSRNNRSLFWGNF